jgi:LacI family transcriptional regulator
MAELRFFLTLSLQDCQIRGTMKLAYASLMHDQNDMPPRVGVRLIDWAQGFSYRLYGGILDYTRKGYPMVLDFEQPNAREIHPISIDRSWKGDGLLVFRYTAEEARIWKKHGISVVNLSSESPGNVAHFPRVTLDNYATGRMAADHLMSLQLQNYAVVVDENRIYSKQRAQGFSERLEQAGKSARIISIPTSKFPAASRADRNLQTAMLALSKLPLPCGIFCKDDLCAVWIIRALHHIGLRVPQDVAVLGVSDDMVHCMATTPAISSLHYPGRAIGHAAAELLGRMMRGEAVEPDTHICIPPKGLVVRESSGQVELPDAVVTSALRWIRSTVTLRPAAVEELCRALGVSREVLRQKFHEALGKSPKQIIDHMRADVVGEKLLNQNWTVDVAATQCGFSSSDDLCRFFKRIKGCTIKDWRKQRGEKMS